MKASKQSGFVLVVGMMLLTVASGAVISSMSVNKYQERQAGNYVRTNNYEAGADEAFRRFERESWGEEIKAGVEGRLGDFEEGAIIFPLDGDDNWLPSDEREERAREREEEKKNEENESGDDENIKYAFTQAGIKELVKLEGDRVKVVFWGRGALGDNSGIDYGNGRDILQAVYSIGSSPGPYQDALVGCEGVTVNAGGKITNGGIRTLMPGAGVRLSGGTSVDGDVTTLGEVATDGSSTIAGDIHADDDVVINSSAVYGGSIATTGSVVFGNSATVQGNVLANGDVAFNNAATVAGDVSSGGKVVFTNSSASVGGDIESQQEIINTANGKKDEDYASGSIKIGSHQNVSSVSSGECDPPGFAGDNNLKAEMRDLLVAFPPGGIGANKNITVGSYPTVNASLAPGGLSAFDETWNVQKDVTLAEAATVEAPTFEKPVAVIRTKDFTQKNGELNVSGGDVVLLVDGDLTLGSGGGKGLTIDPGSTLTIFVTGETHIKSSTQMADVPATTNGRSTLSLYSNHKDSDSYSRGVLIDGSAQALANIYAPYANVSVTAGGGLRGSARGETVTVDGGAGIEYVPRSTSGGGNGSGENDGGWELEGLSYSE